MPGTTDIFDALIEEGWGVSVPSMHSSAEPQQSPSTTSTLVRLAAATQWLHRQSHHRFPSLGQMSEGLGVIGGTGEDLVTTFQRTIYSGIGSRCH